MIHIPITIRRPSAGGAEARPFRYAQHREDSRVSFLVSCGHSESAAASYSETYVTMFQDLLKISPISWDTLSTYTKQIPTHIVGVLHIYGILLEVCFSDWFDRSYILNITERRKYAEKSREIKMAINRNAIRFFHGLFDGTTICRIFSKSP
jgi:hypothetical protein